MTSLGRSNVGVGTALKKQRTIKCVVWDLDNTLWDGVLLEGDEIILRPAVLEVIQTLDGRGILHSIASKNDYATAMAKLDELGVRDYFLCPQIGWNSKVTSLQSVAEALNIGLDAIAFVDDQVFEREEVAFSLPDVLCVDARDVPTVPDMLEMQPRFITEDSRNRRRMYVVGMERDQAEKEFVGSSEAFLTTLNMHFIISSARESDLQRAEELTVRTNQLNSTGRTYSYDELHAFLQSDQHKLLIAELSDKFGTYGKIGLVLVECRNEVWMLKLLLMSCRVISKGVGTILLNHIMRLAKDAGVRLQAEFVSNNRNRMMYITYKFAGFREAHKQDGLILFEHDLSHIPPYPEYVKVEIVND